MDVPNFLWGQIATIVAGDREIAPRDRVTNRRLVLETAGAIGQGASVTIVNDNSQTLHINDGAFERWQARKQQGKPAS